MRALIIGINYTGTRYELRGCINDVIRVRDLLFQVYGVTSVVTMMDTLAPSNPLFPSRENICTQLRKLISSIESGETGFLHFAGHGLIRIPNEVAGGPAKGADYGQGYDDGGCMIVPADAIAAKRRIARSVPDGASRDVPAEAPRSTAMMSGRPEIRRDRMITNDELWDMCVNLRKDATLFAVVDACHSGKILELPYQMVLNRAEYGTTCSLQRSDDHHPGGGSVILLSACEENQESADTHIEGRPTGALSYAFCETLRNQPNITHLALLKAMRAFMDANLPKEFRQVPQLSFSHMTDCTRMFRIGSPIGANGDGDVVTPRGVSIVSPAMPVISRSGASGENTARVMGLRVASGARAVGLLPRALAAEPTVAKIVDPTREASPLDRKTGRPLCFSAYPSLQTLGGGA